MTGKTTPTGILLVGCARSGTTVAQREIAHATHALTLPETGFLQDICGDSRWHKYGTGGYHFFHRWRMANDRLWPRRRKAQRMLARVAGELSQPPPPTLPSKVSDALTPVTELLERSAREAGAPAWIGKTPNNIYCLDEVSRWLSQLWAIHLVRDGCDTVASLEDAARRYAGQPGHDFAIGMQANVARWNRAVRITRACLRRPRHLLLTYHDLVERRLHSLDPLFDALPRSALDAPPDNVLARDHEHWKQAAIDSPLCAAPGKFESVFDPQQQAWVREHLLGGGDVQRAHGLGAQPAERA